MYYWVSAFISFRQCNKTASLSKTFGYYRFEIIAAFINGITLFVIAALIVVEAYIFLLFKSKQMLMLTKRISTQQRICKNQSLAIQPIDNANDSVLV